jgi:hypothetical protein
MMIMSGSWFDFLARETERENPPRGRVGCKRRLTRHDWNGGNNYLAEEMLGYVHGSKTMASCSMPSSGNRALLSSSSNLALGKRLHDNQPNNAISSDFS